MHCMVVHAVVLGATEAQQADMHTCGAWPSVLKRTAAHSLQRAKGSLANTCWSPTGLQKQYLTTRLRIVLRSEAPCPMRSSLTPSRCSHARGCLWGAGRDFAPTALDIGPQSEA